MNADKIIQIIPAPSDLLLRYKQDDGEMERWKPLCIALVEYGDGGTEIKLVDVDTVGYIDFADDADIYDGIDWIGGNPCNHYRCHCDFKQNTAQGAANTRDGRAEQIETAVSTSIMNETEEKVK